MTTNLPKCRQSDLVVQSFDKELLVYDLITHRAFQLNETCMRVFEACGGKQTFEDLKAQFNFTDEIIYLTLDELEKENLLDKKANYQSPFKGINRRELVRRIGLASAITLPIVSGIIAPTAAAAASTCGSICLNEGEDYCVGCGRIGFILYSEPNCSGGVVAFGSLPSCTDLFSYINPGQSVRRYGV